MNTFIGLETFLLNLSSLDNSSADVGTGFTRIQLTELGEGNGLNLAVNIDVVEDFLTPFTRIFHSCEKGNCQHCSDHT